LPKSIKKINNQNRAAAASKDEKMIDRRKPPSFAHDHGLEFRVQTEETAAGLHARCSIIRSHVRPTADSKKL